MTRPRGRQASPYEKSHAAICQEPVAFNAHLSHWRTPQGSLQRCAFYQMTWMRFNGVPFAPEITDRPLLNFDPLFSLSPAETFLQSIIRSSICTGCITVAGEVIRNSPLSPEQESSFVDLHRVRMESLEKLNRDALSDWQSFVTEWGLFFDASEGCLADLIARNGHLRLDVRGKLTGLEAKATVLNEERPFFHHIPLSCEIHENSAAIGIRPQLEGVKYRNLLIELKVYLGDNQKSGHFKIAPVVT